MEHTCGEGMVGHDRANATQIRTKSILVVGTLPGATDSDLNDHILLRITTVVHFTNEESSKRKISKLPEITCKLVGDRARFEFWLQNPNAE